MELIKQFFIAFVSFLILDFLWLGIVIRDFTLRQLSDIARLKDGKIDVLFPAALPVYVVMALAVVCFVLPKVSGENPLMLALMWGALMGFITFGLYDFTNLAILKNYPLTFALVDIAWGTFAFAVVSTLTWKLTA